VSTSTVTDVPGSSRYEIEMDGKPAGFTEYRREPGVIAFVHTQVEPDYEGQGVGSRLIRAALDAARADRLAVLPYCPFVREFIEAHHEYLDLVPVEARGEFGLGEG
jgi:predicted GNAT family acetyltransferase